MWLTYCTDNIMTWNQFCGKIMKYVKDSKVPNTKIEINERNI